MFPGIFLDRDGVINILKLMGADITLNNQREVGGEPVADIRIKYAPLKGINIPEDQVPLAIDEFPAIFIVAACAEGETVLTGAEELRVKESDRIKAVVAMLRVNGVEVEETDDGFIVHGCSGAVPGGGLVETHHDHRIAMSALIMGTASQKPVSIDDAAMIATSYPDFMDHMAELGADISEGKA